MDGIVYNDRQMKDFLTSLIHSLDILKMGWVNLKIDSLNKYKQLNRIRLDGPNEIEC